MGYARHIGRVGALALTLGVGVAVATTPGIAYADPSGSSTSSNDSSSSTSTSTSGSSSSTTTPSGSSASSAATSGSAATGDSVSPAASTSTGTAQRRSAASSAAEQDALSGSQDDSALGSHTLGEKDSLEGAEATLDGALGDGAGELAGGATEAETLPVEEDAAPLEATPVPVEEAAQNSAGGDASNEQTTGTSTSALSVTAPDVSGDADSTALAAAGQLARFAQLQPRTFTLTADADALERYAAAQAPSYEAPSAATVPTPSNEPAPAPAAPPQRFTLVDVVSGVVSELLAAVFQPLLGPAQGSPLQLPILTAVLSAVRDEFERIFSRTVARATTPVATLLAPPDQRVLVIGVDGANLSRILADEDNVYFRQLMAESTTAPSSIVGHTTLSNPSWTAVLTGAWGERTGVINNVFTPWTYDQWPTMFNQVEAINPDIETMTIANWDVINAISATGENPVDRNVFIGQVANDPNWLLTDDAVGAATVAAISGTDVPNLLFTYFSAPDHNGHAYGGASAQYAEALTNVDANLGAILGAIEEWETNNPGQEWTVIVVTDHGHQPQVGFGHGFQSPDETETFVIARGPDFEDGWMNLQYEIVDTTPTVVALFGGTPRADADGVPLMTLADSDVEPVNLEAALEAAIARNGYPDIYTNIALGVRTIFASVPYFIYTYGHDFAATLPDILAVPLRLIIDGLYVLTNIPAQIVAYLTGVSSASIFPLLPPTPPWFEPTDDATLPDAAALACSGTSGSAGRAACGEAIVA